MPTNIKIKILLQLNPKYLRLGSNDCLFLIKKYTKHITIKEIILFITAVILIN